MLDDEDNFDVDAMFEHGLSQCADLWRRLGVKPDFRGQSVLEVGSGLGFLSAHIAQAGAAQVLGVDIWAPRVAYATRKVAARFPELSHVQFDSTPTDQMPGSDQFDLIVSQNTFEHIGDIGAVLASFHRLLRPGGRAYLGFSPLYHSPFGDHGELRAPVRLPWLHLLAGRKRVIAAFNKANGLSVTTLPECGYNGLKPADFRKAFAQSGMVVEQIRINPTEGRLKQTVMALFAGLARLPFLQPYVTIGMYVVLRKP
jgi:SAM-dependent methyltransferase